MSRFFKCRAASRAGLLFIIGIMTLATTVYADTASDKKSRLEKKYDVTKQTPDKKCLLCHGVKGFAIPKTEIGEGRKRKLHVNIGNLYDSAHKKQDCVDCHDTIKKVPHKKVDFSRQVKCVQCHEKKALAKKDKIQPYADSARTMVGLPPKLDALKKNKLQKNAAHYLASIHSKPRKDDPKRPNASCGDCHGTHNVSPMTGKRAEKFRLNTPKMCGSCHQKALKAYTNSVHGAAVKRKGNLKAAVCSDCHSAHKISSTKKDNVKLAITHNCGSCHEKALKSYRATYHGQVANLGYAHTAKCSDCHSAHKTLNKKNPHAQIHPNNLVKTCGECHKNATPSFVKFQPHGNTHDFERFPIMWITSKFMIALVIIVFFVFWGHSYLWFRRERLENKDKPAKSDEIDVEPSGKYVMRFNWQVRAAHLLLALAVMTLALTGTAVLYSESFWAPTVMKLLGGAKSAAIIHRVAATVFGLLFFGHIISVMMRIYKRRKSENSFKWFGPESLVPNKRDWKDFLSMKRWFAGKGARPDFEKWTYWEKFDYWAPFWGMFIIGTSGILLWFSPFFGSILPGWIFNVATIVHGEEAFLAIVFLFTVHFFNSHFRPDKYPLDIIMFTGSMPLEEFKHERADEYKRLLDEGTFDSYLVDPPSKGMVKRSRILGFTLIGAGLLILVLVLTGFIGEMFS